MDVTDFLLLIQLLFLIGYPIKQYSKSKPDILGVVLSLGYLQFVLVPLFVNKNIKMEESWYPFYAPVDGDYLFFISYLSICLLLFFTIWVLGLGGGGRIQPIVLSFPIRYKRIIPLLLFCLAFKCLLPSMGFVTQFLSYIFHGVAAYIFLVLLVSRKRSFLHLIALVLAAAVFWGSTIRFVYLVMAFFVYLASLHPLKRPKFVVVLISLFLIALGSLMFKVVVKQGNTTNVKEAIVHRLQTFDLANAESFPIVAHFERHKDEPLLGRTFLTASVIPWLLSDEFVGMGKHYIKNVVGVREHNPNWSINYPFPYELFANFGPVIAVFLFVYFFLVIGLLIRSRGNYLIDLWKTLFAVSFVFYLFRGDFVFAFVPSVCAAIGGFMALLVLFNGRGHSRLPLLQLAWDEVDLLLRKWLRLNLKIRSK